MITIIIVILTSLVSIACFNRMDLFTRLAFEPYFVKTKKEYFRFLSHTLVHADWIHLLVNMLVFFSFGRYVEYRFLELQQEGIIFSGRFYFLALYVAGAIAASLPDYLKHSNNPEYISVGASGAVSAVLFTSIFFSPLEKIYFYGILPMPGFVFGILYLVYSSYMARKGNDNINHGAHLWGAVLGVIFPIILDPSLVGDFINHF